MLCGEIDALPDVAAADVVLVLADDGGGTGLFALDATSAGVSVTERTQVDPTRKMFDVGLNDVESQWLASPSAEDVQALVDDVLIIYAADALGAATAVMNLAVEYAKVRRQFDQPIGLSGGPAPLRRHVRERRTRTQRCPPRAVAADTAQPGERHLAAVRAKAYAGQLATVADTAIQVFGGVGYTWEHDAHLYLKRLLGWSAFGSSDKYLQEVGRALQ